MKGKSTLSLSNMNRRRQSNMASRCNPQCTRNSRLSLWLLALVLTVIWSVTESAAELRGKVGGNVTFDCSFKGQGKIEFFYLQKGQAFVNGYHALNTINNTWKNTELDRPKTSVHMYQLNMSHNGDYNCLIWHSNSNSVSNTVIHLNVTANYSKPAVRVYCHNDGSSCLVMCSSHGGYPEAKMMWNVPRSQIWATVNSSEKRDPVTLTFNSSSTAIFNCSKGESKLLSCSVDDVTSDTFRVCTPWEDPPSLQKPAIAAISSVVAVFVVGTLLLLLHCKNKKGLRRGARVQSTENEYEQEIKVLTRGNGGEES